MSRRMRVTAVIDKLAGSFGLAAPGPALLL
jgi:hypothetical protein